MERLRPALRKQGRTAPEAGMRIRKTLFVLFCAAAAAFTAPAASESAQDTLQRLNSLRNEGKADEALAGYLALAKTAGGGTAAYAHFFAGQILLTKNQPQAAQPHLYAALKLAEAQQEKAFIRLALYSRFQLGIAAVMEEKHANAREEFLLCLRKAENTGEVLLTEQAHLELLRLALRHAESFASGTGPQTPAGSASSRDFDAYFEKEISPHAAPFLREPYAPADHLALRLEAARAFLDTRVPGNIAANERLASQALRLAERCAEFDRESWLFEKARAETALSRYTQALASVNALPHKNADAVILEANIHIRMGNEERAFALLQNAGIKARDGERRLLMSRYAHLLLQARRYAEAAPILEELSEYEAPGGNDEKDTFARRQALLDLASLALASNDAPLAERRIRASGVTNSAGMRLLTAALIAQGKTDEAARSIRQAAEAAHSPQEGAELAILEASLAYTTGDFERVASAAARAAESARLAHIPRVEAEALILEARTTENSEAAAALLTRAQSVAVAYGLVQIEANIRHNLAVLALSSGKNDEAVRGFKRALELFDSTRARFALRSEERLQYTSSWSETQRFLALAYLAENRLEEAWEAYEHSLAREAREALAEALLRSSPDFAESVRAQERALETLQYAYETGASAQEIERQMHSLSESTKRVERGLRSGTRGGLAGADRKKFSQLLKQNGALALQYLVWPDKTPGIVFIIDGDGITAVQLPPSDAMLRDAARFRDIASRPLLSRVWDAQLLGTKNIDLRMSFVTNGLALHKALLEPMQARWQAARASSLLIIADGELASFPFAALPQPGDKWNAGRNWPACIGDEIPVMTAVSATAWMEGQALARNTGAVILAGDVGTRALRGERVMQALPGSGREIDGIARIFGQLGQRTLFARGSEATPERLTSLLREKPAILHLATHGFFLTNASTGRRYGALLLAESGDASTPDTREARDDNSSIPRGSILGEDAIAGLPLVGSLVTLSSCESARGRVVAGEGMLSLMRAFVIAGVKNVSAALWIIGDDSTAEYMVRYYKHIAAGTAPSAAHRDTRRELYDLGFWPSQRSGFITSN